MNIAPNMTSGSITLDARFVANRKGVTVQINGRQYHFNVPMLMGMTRRLLCAR